MEFLSQANGLGFSAGKEFNWQQYLINYKELLKQGINTKEKVLAHYLMFGMNKNMTDKVLVEFDWLNYLNSNEDLQYIGINNKTDAIDHWVRFGYNEKREIKNIESINNQNIFYITNVKIGGSWKYIMDLISIYRKYNKNFYRISDKKELNYLRPLIKKGDILIFQFLFHTDFTFSDIIKLVDEYDLQLILPIHDNYYLNNLDKPTNDIHSKCENIKEIKKELFQKAKHIIFPSKYIHDKYCQYINLENFKIVYHSDLKISENYLRIPKVEENINIGIITELSVCKGGLYIEELVKKYKYFNTNEKVYKINFILYNLRTFATNYDNVIKKGSYNETDIFKKLENDKIHCILFLNEWPETYCYALTKGIISGLPLLYTNIGAISERLANLSKEYYFPTNNKDLYIVFEKLLNYIINYNNIELGEKPIIEMVANEFYDQLFLNKKEY
jgi:hypothetical protein